jgi:hypothetical protein
MNQKKKARRARGLGSDLGSIKRSLDPPTALVGKGLMNIRIADGLMNFLLSPFLYFDFNFLSGILQNMIRIACNSRIPHAKGSKG